MPIPGIVAAQLLNVAVGGSVSLSPAVANLLLSGSAPAAVVTGGSASLSPTTANLLLSSAVPTVQVSGGAGATPTFRSTDSAVAHTTTALSVPYPAGLAADDILILPVNFAGTGVTMTTPTDFTQIGNTEDYGADGAGHTLHSALYWKRATGSESGSLALTKSGNGGTGSIFYGALLAYQGCLASGDPIDGTPTDVTDTTSPYTMASVTTTGANRRVICAFCIEDNNGRSTGPETGWTNRIHLLSTTGNDGTIAVDDFEQVSAGAPTDDFYGPTGVVEAGVHAFALKPNPAG